MGNEEDTGNLDNGINDKEQHDNEPHDEEDPKNEEKPDKEAEVAQVDAKPKSVYQTAYQAFQQKSKDVLQCLNQARKNPK